MKFYKIYGEMDYPVGEHMYVNLPIIKNMATQLRVLYPGENLILYCAGSSGAIIAGILTLLLLPGREVRIAHVKKEGEHSHDTARMYKPKDSKAIIVDDFIATGNTINRIYSFFKDRNENTAIDCLCVSGPVKLDCLDFVPIAAIGEILRGTETDCLNYSYDEEESTI